MNEKFSYNILFKKKNNKARKKSAKINQKSNKDRKNSKSVISVIIKENVHINF